MRILIVEDERSLSRALLAILEKNGYSADAVYDGRTALDYIALGEYDGVLLDIMMPGMDGGVQLSSAGGQYHSRPGCHGALIGGGKLPAHKQGIPGDGALNEQSETAHHLGTYTGEDMGI